MTAVAQQKLFQSCRVLFDLDREVCWDFLNYIQLSGLKSAYRQKVRETHPDLAAGQNLVMQRRRTDRFMLVQQAYENLSGFLRDRDQAPVANERRNNGYSKAVRPVRPRPQADKGGARPANPPAPPAGPWNFETLYQGPMPRRPLLFGHYLYYSGAITWRTIVSALIWQRKQRPRLGELGYSLGWLRQHDIRGIVCDRRNLLPFGESAIQRGLLTEMQVRILLYRQQKSQRKFGEYFVENRLMSSAHLERRLHEFHAHNNRFARPAD